MSFMMKNKVKCWKGYNKISARDNLQDINLSQLKSRITSMYNEDQKVKTMFEAKGKGDVVNTVFL